MGVIGRGGGTKGQEQEGAGAGGGGGAGHEKREASQRKPAAHDAILDT